MAYKKPQMVAKSSAKKSYVAGCVANTPFWTNCLGPNSSCLTGPLK